MITTEALHGALDELLRTESWEILTLKVVLSRLEQKLLPQHPPGTLKPFKKGIKVEVDTLMKAMLKAKEDPSSGTQPPAASEPEPPKDEAPQETGKPAEAQEDDAGAAPAAKRQRRDDDENSAPKPEQPAGAMDPSAEPETTADGADGADGAEGSDDLGEESDPDEDAPRVVGKPISKADGKVFYEKLVKGDETLKVGQDVYLENNMDIPYVARLQDIFTYSFAPTEVYFNARWYYRVGDCHEHAEKEVRHKGNALAPHEKEHELKERLFEAVYERGENISDLETLCRIAGDAGLDTAGFRAVADTRAARDGVNRECAQASARGVQGVPFFIVHGAEDKQPIGFSGAVDPDEFEKILRQVL